MKRILVLALGHLSNGEITIALETLKGVGAQGHELLFVSHEWGRKYVASFDVPSRTLDASDPRDNKKAFAAILAEFKPDLLVCADVYTMEYASTWSGVDFAYLKSLGLPLGSFDEYEWESSDFKWDYMGAVASRIKPDLIHDCDFLIRPCPLNKPVETDGRVVSCRLLSTEPREPRMSEAAWRDRLGIESGRKVIFTVNSGWEYVNVSPNPQVAALIRWMPRMLHNEIASAQGPIAVVHVGPKPWDFEIDPGLQYRYLARADAELYQECEMRADLFCGTNATSITLTKAAAALTPCLLFQNLKSLDFAALESIMPRMPAWYRDMAAEVGKAAPFRIFPWGWANFLKTVFDSNPYSGAFAEAPVFMPDKCRKAIDAYLHDETAITAMKERQSAYFGSLSALAPVGEFLETIG